MDACPAPPLQPHLSRYKRLSLDRNHVAPSFWSRLWFEIDLEPVTSEHVELWRYQEEANCVYSCFLRVFHRSYPNNVFFGLSRM